MLPKLLPLLPIFGSSGVLGVNGQAYVSPGRRTNLGNSFLNLSGPVIAMSRKAWILTITFATAVGLAVEVYFWMASNPAVTP